MEITGSGYRMAQGASSGGREMGLGLAPGLRNSLRGCLSLKQDPTVSSPLSQQD